MARTSSSSARAAACSRSHCRSRASTARRCRSASASASLACVHAEAMGRARKALPAGPLAHAAAPQAGRGSGVLSGRGAHERLSLLLLSARLCFGVGAGARLRRLHRSGITPSRAPAASGAGRADPKAWMGGAERHTRGCTSALAGARFAARRGGLSFAAPTPLARERIASHSSASSSSSSSLSDCALRTGARRSDCRRAGGA